MSYWAALCEQCQIRAQASEFCEVAHLTKRDCEWCGGDFKGSCTMLAGDRPRPDVCTDTEPKVAGAARPPVR